MLIMSRYGDVSSLLAASNRVLHNAGIVRRQAAMVRLNNTMQRSLDSMARYRLSQSQMTARPPSINESIPSSSASHRSLSIRGGSSNNSMPRMHLLLLQLNYYQTDH